MSRHANPLSSCASSRCALGVGPPGNANCRASGPLIQAPQPRPLRAGALAPTWAHPGLRLAADTHTHIIPRPHHSLVSLPPPLSSWASPSPTHTPPPGPLPHPHPSPWASPSPTPLPLGHNSSSMLRLANLTGGKQRNLQSFSKDSDNEEVRGSADAALLPSTFFLILDSFCSKFLLISALMFCSVRFVCSVPFSSLRVTLFRSMWRWVIGWLRRGQWRRGQRSCRRDGIISPPGVGQSRWKRKRGRR